MKHVINDIRTRLKDATVKSFGDEVAAVDPALDLASNPQFGDFQSNVALTLSKQLKQQPRQIAEKIVSNLSVDESAKSRP
jgi:arginyl-tRNA synthetase